ncbi:MAG: stage III sporulation protein AA [Clostridiales bacterium]|nr:stage III sporulation protein AA [Clostridiales bacterium]
MQNQILRYFSKKISQEIEMCLNEHLEEIRLRVNKPIILRYDTYETKLKFVVKTEDVLETLQNICENSIYAYQKEICEGFITVKKGHRVGIAGNVVIENEKVKNIKYISSLNFRIAKEISDCSKKILKYILDIENNNVYNTLIVSPPGGGKTTILRDLIKNISNGIDEINFKGLNVGLVDERGELAAMYKGAPQNDVGLRTDVLDNIPKAIGMKLLIRSMAPQVISADEIGAYEDIKAIDYAICSGVKGVFTAHGNSLEQIFLNPILSELLNKHVFERIIILNKKEIEETHKLSGGKEYVSY